MEILSKLLLLLLRLALSIGGFLAIPLIIASFPKAKLSKNEIDTVLLINLVFIFCILCFFNPSFAANLVLGLLSIPLSRRFMLSRCLKTIAGTEEADVLAPSQDKFYIKCKSKSDHTAEKIIIENRPLNTASSAPAHSSDSTQEEILRAPSKKHEAISVVSDSVLEESSEDTKPTTPMVEPSNEAPAKTQPKQKSKTRFCSRCGATIDPVTKKCDGCGKQYFRGFSLKVSASVAVCVLLLVSLAFNFYQYKENSKLNNSNSAGLITDSRNVFLCIGEQHIMNLNTRKFSSSSIRWKSSNATVANVSSDGIITALKEGTATVSILVDGVVKDSYTVAVFRTRAQAGMAALQEKYNRDSANW